MSLFAARRGLKIFLYLLASAGLFFLMGQFLVLEITLLRILLNASVLVSLYAFMFRSGAQAGEGDVTFAEIALSRSEKGKDTTREQIDRCFHPGKGYLTAFTGALPLLVACLVFAFMTRESRYSLGTLPSWLSVFRERADIGLALSYYSETTRLQALDFLRLLVRLLIFPYMNLAGAGDAATVLLVERLSPLLLAVAPLSYGIGYSRGEHYRAIVHGGIAANKRKAARQQKKQQPPSNREPRQLV